MEYEEDSKAKKAIPHEKIRIASYLKYAKYSWEVEGRKILTKHQLEFSKNEKQIIKGLLLSPMPNDLRNNYWMIASGARREMLNNKDYYSTLLKKYPDSIPSPFKQQIGLDLQRTFPEDPFFAIPANSKMLSNILLAYSRRSVSIGYFQGFNFIVGRILKQLRNEEETFWLFTQVIEQILPMNFYHQYTGMMVDCSIINKFLSKHNNDILIHLTSIDSMLILNNILFKWLVSIFSQNISEKFYLCIWDTMLLQGNIVMFKASLGLLKLLSNEIKQQTSIETMMSLFDENSTSFKSRSKLIYYLLVKRYDFDMKLIKRKRAELFPLMLESLKPKSHNQQQQSYASNNKKKTICKEEWPFCVSDSSVKKGFNEYIIFKQSSFPALIENYFKGKRRLFGSQKRRGGYSFDSKSMTRKIIDAHGLKMEDDEMKMFNSLVIERKKHDCFKCEHHSRPPNRAKTITDNNNNGFSTNNIFSSYFETNDNHSYQNQPECITIITDIGDKDKDDGSNSEEEVKKEWYENPEVFYETFN